jgi:hypothetical protein
MTDLEALYAAPAADIGPTSPRAELLAAAETLRRRGGWFEGELCMWLVDTATVHGPDDDGRHCFRDGDEWPCGDVHAAQKVALAVGYTPTP